MQVIGNDKIAERGSEVNTLSAALGRFGRLTLPIRFTIGTIGLVCSVLQPRASFLLEIILVGLKDPDDQRERRRPVGCKCVGEAPL
jgi:hypothetical protein